MTPQHVTLLDLCILEAERCAPECMKRSIDATLASLLGSENAIESGQQRQLMAQAIRSLTQNPAVMIRTLPAPCPHLPAPLV